MGHIRITGEWSGNCRICGSRMYYSQGYNTDVADVALNYNVCEHCAAFDNVIDTIRELEEKYTAMEQLPGWWKRRGMSQLEKDIISLERWRRRARSMEIERANARAKFVVQHKEDPCSTSEKPPQS